MEKRIIMSRGGRLQLALDFEVTPRMVYKALNWKGNSELAQRLRSAALERGGELYERVPAERMIAEQQSETIN